MKKIIFLWLISLLSLHADLDAELVQEQHQQTSKAITIIFDDSGSMKDRQKMKQAKKAFYAWLKAQSDQDRFSLIHFEKGGRILVPLGKNTKDLVLKAVEKLRPRYNTPIANCIKIAAEQIAERRQQVAPYERHIVVVFTDGAETQSKLGNRAVVNAIRQVVASGNGIEVVGIGFHGEGDYMAKAATSFYTADNAEQLRDSLEKVSAEVPSDLEFDLSPKEAELMKTMDFQSAAQEAHKSLETHIQKEEALEEEDGKSGFPWVLIILVFVFFRVASLFSKKK